MKNILQRSFLAVVLILQFGCASEETPYLESVAPTCQRTKLENQHIVHWKNHAATLEYLGTKELRYFTKKNKQEIQFIEPNYFLSGELPDANATVHDFNFVRPASTIHDVIHTPYLWQRGFYGQEIVIAIIDTGINLNHPQLINRLKINSIESQYGMNGVDDDGNGFIDDIYGWNFVDNRTESNDEHGHGTAMAGIITGSVANRPSLSLAPESKILPVDFMNETGGTEYHAKLAMSYAVSRKVHIINNSWSINCSELLKEAFYTWKDENIIFVNAAGNSPIDVVTAGIVPSSLNLSNNLNVGSLDDTGHRSAFSGYGETVRVFAPGEFIPTIYPSSGLNQSVPSSGTSVSTAVVSGAAALLWSAFPQAKATQIVDLITRSADQQPFSERSLNLKKAYELGNEIFNPNVL